MCVECMCGHNTRMTNGWFHLCSDCFPFRMKGTEMVVPVEEESPNKTMGNCRICRKLIQEDESFHTCSNCHQYVCDDCSSYSSRDDTKVIVAFKCEQTFNKVILSCFQYWMCSFCRRRGSHLIPGTVGEPLAMKRVPSFNRMVCNHSDSLV